MGWLAREDADILFLAASAGFGVGVYSVSLKMEMGEAVGNGLMAASGVSGLVYLVRSLMHATPQAMESVLSVMAFRKQAANLGGGEARPFAAREALPREATREERWRQALRRFLTGGRLIGSYSMRQMAYDRELVDGRRRRRLVTETGWRRLVEVLQRGEVLVSGNGGTRWARGMDYGRAVYCVKHTLIMPNSNPPEVRLGAW